MDDTFWIHEPTILFRKDKILELWPYEYMSFESKLNATTRFIICITILGFMILNNYLILLFGIVLLLIIVSLFLYIKKNNYESYENNILNEKKKFTKENPLYNVLLSDYQDNVNKEKVKTKYDETHEDAINESVKHFVLENNKDNKDIGNIFKNLTNNIEFESSMRQFHMNPNTTIPNDQKDFLKYCYGDLYSEKPLLIH